MSRTPNRNYPYPDPENPYALTTDLAELAKAIDTDVHGVDGGGSGTLAINDLSDVNTAASAVVDGQALVYNATAGEWRPSDLSSTGGATTLNGLTDVDTFTVAPTGGQSLVYDAVDGLWKPGVGSTGGSVNGLTDVDTATFPPVGGQALVWDATAEQWMPGSASGSSSLDDLTDVDLTTAPPASGQALVFNGTVWEPYTMGSGGGAMVWRGAYAATTTYGPGDVVSSDAGTFVAKSTTSQTPSQSGAATVLFSDTFDTDLTGWDVNNGWSVVAGRANITTTSPLQEWVLLKTIQAEGTATFDGFAVEHAEQSSDVLFCRDADTSWYSYSPRTGKINRYVSGVGTTTLGTVALTANVADRDITVTVNGGDITVTQVDVNGSHTLTVTDPSPLTGTRWGVVHYGYEATTGDDTWLDGFTFSVEQPPVWDAVAVLEGATSGEKLYVEGGALKFRGGNGTVTTIAPA